MRVNVFEAGLVTLLMAAKGFAQAEDDTPKRGAETASWNSAVLPVPAKPGRKADTQ